MSSSDEFLLEPTRENNNDNNIKNKANGRLQGAQGHPSAPARFPSARLSSRLPNLLTPAARASMGSLWAWAGFVPSGVSFCRQEQPGPPPKLRRINGELLEENMHDKDVAGEISSLFKE